MSFYYDMDGNPITQAQWVAGFESRDRQIAKTDFPDGVWVSTVWLGIDHRFGGVGAPLIFETMIFEGPLDGEQWRYSTRERALAGHARAVALVEAHQAAYDHPE